MPELQKKYPIGRLGVFGSYARGEATEKSDIDIAVEITGPMGLNFVAMADEIEDLFGKKTDVVPLRSIKPQYLHLFKEILCMPERKSSTIIKDILNCIDHIQLYISGLSYEDFSKNFMAVEAKR
jgi:predicted nucleotidyltransferase